MCFCDFLGLNGLVVCGLYLCNPCNPWLYKMVHAQVMLWCLDGLTGLCGVKLSLRSELCALCVTGLELVFVVWKFFYGGSAGRAARAGSEACATWRFVD